MDEHPPMREVIAGFTAVIVKHDAFVQHARDQQRRNWCEQERGVRRGKDMHDICPSQ